MIVGFEGLPGVGKTTAVARVGEALMSLGCTWSVVPEVVVPMDPPPTPPVQFVRNDAVKWRLARTSERNVVLMDRTWVSTNACNEVLSELRRDVLPMSARFAVDVWVFFDRRNLPSGAKANRADWPWTLPGFPDAWESAARRLIGKAGGEVISWSGSPTQTARTIHLLWGGALG